MCQKRCQGLLAKTVGAFQISMVPPYFPGAHLHLKWLSSSRFGKKKDEPLCSVESKILSASSIPNFPAKETQKLYYFSTVTLTNDHKWSLNKNWFYSSGAQKSNIGLAEPKSRCWQGWIPSGGPRGDSVCLSFSSSTGLLHSLACGPFLHL